MKRIFKRWKKLPPPSPVRLTLNTFFYWDWRLPYIKRRMKKNIFTEALLSDILMVLGDQGEGKSPACLKLSNSGEALKLWLSINGTKAICKWINNPFAVTISKMMEMETEIGNRGSKSIIGMPIHTFVIIVNEQRVYGSWWEKYKNTRPKIHKCISHLRCTLMGFERNYKISALYNTIHISRGFYTNNKKVVLRSSGPRHGMFLARLCSGWGQETSLENFKLHPLWVTGFIDGEGCFHVSIIKRKRRKSGWQVLLYFDIHLKKKDLPLLKLIRKFFGVGRIYLNKDNSISYIVTSVKDLQVIIEHFEKYLLITKKRADFELWSKIFYIFKNKKHLTVEGFNKILAMKAALNWGLSDELKKSFPNVVPVVRPLVIDQKIPDPSPLRGLGSPPVGGDPHWLAGFTSAEGSFQVSIFQGTTNIGETVKLVFNLSQHSRDEQLLRRLIKFFKCGNIYKNRDGYSFIVSKFKDIYFNIIPFFMKYSIHGVKALDFRDFCLLASIIKDKKHLTKDGLDKIKKIKSGMNRERNLR